MTSTTTYDRHGGRMDYVDTVPCQPAEACTEIGVDNDVPEGFAVAALFVAAMLVAVIALAVIAANAF